MKKLLLFCVAALSAVSAFAADVVPTFNATLTVGKESRFVLLGSDGKASSWLKLGDSFEGYTIKSYDPKASALELERDGKVTRVTIAADAAVASGAGAAAGGAQATIADATAVLDSMHFEEMLDRTFAGVKKQQLAMLNRMIPADKMGADREDRMALQKKVMDEMMSALTGPGLKEDMAKVYSQTFTKDELQGLANFYSSPLGQSFSEKQPVLAEKMNEILMPRMMAAMPKIQQMTQQFAAEQRAKHEAAAAAASGSAAPAAPTSSAAPAASGKR